MKILTRRKQKQAIKLIEESYKLICGKILADSFTDGTIDKIAENMVDVVDIVGNMKD